MNKNQFLFFSFLFILVFSSCSVAQSAKNKTQREISKKTNQKIEDIFSGKEEESENQNAERTTDNKGQQVEVNRKVSEFVPGEEIIFVDSQKVERLGEFSSKWDLLKGTVEVMEVDGANVIGFVTKGIIFPLIENEDYLTDEFTVEFDCYFHNYGNEGYYLKFDNKDCDFRVSREGLVKGDYFRTDIESLVGWRHVEMSFNNRSLKVYYDGERLLNIPNIKIAPQNLRLDVLSFGAKKNMYVMVKNFRVAKGGVPLYDRLITDGKFVSRQIYFEYNKAVLKPESIDVIDRVAYMLKKYPDVKLKIEGHTDGDGSEEYNLKLSKERADAVKEALEKRGINSSRLESKGLGESQPVATNLTTEGKAMNRRVEFVKI